jgi:hypothetical protein
MLLAPLTRAHRKGRLAMDLEDRLKQLQSLYSYTARAAGAAKIKYLGLLGSAYASAIDVSCAKSVWQQFEARKVAVIADMVELDELELATV